MTSFTSPLTLTAPVASIIAAFISAAISLVALRRSFLATEKLEDFKKRAALEIEEFKAQLQRQLNEEAQADTAVRLVARYRDPLLRTAYDFQSRLYNMLRPNGFRGDDDPTYFQLSTLYVIAEFLGWVEIIRCDMQFLDLASNDLTREFNSTISRIQHRLATTSRIADRYYLYRLQQRAIGELMTVAIKPPMERPGPRYQTIGFAEFCERMNHPNYRRWFDRLGAELSALPQVGSERLRQVQNALIQLIDLLDPDHTWYRTGRSKL